MSSIDERIVEMKFDADQFSDGVKATLQNLEDLKNGLDLREAAKGLDHLDQLGADSALDNIAESVDHIQSAFSSLGVIAVTALVNLTNAAIGYGMQIANAIVDPLVEGGKKRALALEQAKFQFHGLGMDVQKTMDAALYAVKGTAFGLDDAAKAAASLGASQVPLAKMGGVLRAISGVAALTGSSYGDVADVFTKVAGQGKLMGDDLSRLAARGMNAAAALGKAMHKPESEIRDMVTKGKISFDQFSTIMNDAFGEQATKANETYTGSLSNLRAALSRIGASFATPWYEGQRNTFNALTPAIDKVAAALGPVIQLFTDLTNVSAQKIIDFVNKLDFTPLQNGIGPIVEGIRHVIDTVRGLLDLIGGQFIAIFPPASAENIQKVVDAIHKFLMGITISEEATGKLQRTFKGVFAAVDIVRMVLVEAVKMFGRLFGVTFDGSGKILDLTARMGDWVVKVRDAIKNGEGLGKFFTGFGDILERPIKLIKEFLGWIADIALGFKSVDATPWLNGFSGAVDNVKLALEPLGVIGDIVIKVWEKLAGAAERVFKFFAPLGMIMGSFFGTIGTSIMDALSNTDWSGILDGINTGLLAGITAMLWKWFKNGGFDKLASDLIPGKGFLDSIKGAFDGLTGTMEAMQTKLKAEALLKIAGAVALITASVVALTLVDQAKLAGALTAITVMFGQLFGMMKLFEMAKPELSAGKMTVVAGAMIVLAVAIDILTIAVMTLSKLDWNELAKGLLGTTVLLGALVGAVKFMPPASGMVSTGLGLILLASAIKIMASAVGQMVKFNWEELARGISGVGVVLGLLVGFMRTMGDPKKMVSTGVGLILLGAALKIFASALGDFVKFNWEELARGMVAIAVGLGIVAGAMHLMPTNMAMQAAALVVVAAALKILASALTDMSGLSWDDIGRVAVVLAGSLAIIAGALALMPEGLLGAAALIVVAVSLKIMADTFNEMAKMSWDDIGRVAVILAGSLLIIAGAMAIMVEGLPGALALVVMAGALAILAPVLILLGTMSWDAILHGLVALAGALTILGIAGLLLTPTIPTLLGLGAAIALIGLGVALVGAGIFLLATGITALSLSGAAGALAITALGGAIIGLIPMAIKAVGDGLILLIQTLGDGVPALVQAGVKIIAGFLDGLMILAPKIGETVWALADEILKIMADHVPSMVDSGMKILTGFLNGIARNMSQLITAGTNVIVSFLNGIGQNVPRIVQAGIDLILDFVNGLADGINRNAARMREAGGKLAFAIIDGMSGGLLSGAGRVIQAAKDMAAKAFNAAKDFLQINSPSKKFIVLGESTGEGMEKGINNYSGKVEAASENVGKTALVAMKNSFANMADYVASDMDFAPTIRPVLDLSDVQANAGQINGMLGVQPLDVSASSAYASATSDSYDLNQELSQLMAEAGNGDSYTYNQYNNSPKSLSPAEIYRQTNNQLSKKKGELVNAG